MKISKEFDLRIGEHRVAHNRNSMKFECIGCGMERAVPKIFTQGPTRYSRIYQYYIFGQFSNSTCASSDVSETLVNMPSSMSLKFETGSGEVVTQNSIVIKSNDDSYPTGQALTDAEYLELARTSADRKI